MGWYSSKKPIYKLNQLRLGKTQQEEFLRSHLKMNTRQVKELKQKLGGQALSGGKLLTASQWQKIMQEHEPEIGEKWREFVKQKDKEYQGYLEQVKKENIKKVRQMERKQEAADKMVQKLTGREKPGSWREKIKKSIVADRVDLRNDDLTPAAQRVLRKKEELINRKKTDWAHADTGKATTIHEWEEKNKTDKKNEKNSEEKDIDQVKEEAKKLSDMQI